MLIYLSFEERRDYESALIIIKYMKKVAVIFTSHMDGCATLFSHSLELPIIMYRTSLTFTSLCL